MAWMDEQGKIHPEVGWTVGNPDDIYKELINSLTKDNDIPAWLKWWLHDVWGWQPPVQPETQPQELIPQTQTTQTNLSERDTNLPTQRNIPYMNTNEFWSGLAYNPPRPNWGQELKYIARGLLKPSNFGTWYNEPYVQQSLDWFTNDINQRFNTNYTPNLLLALAKGYGSGMAGLHGLMPHLANQLMYSISPEEYHYSGQDLINRGYGGLISALAGTTPKYSTRAKTIENLNRIDTLIGKVKQSLKQSGGKRSKSKGSLLGGKDREGSRTSNMNAKSWGNAYKEWE